jgi:tRNA-binding EMAP/Myf-like protein
MKKNDRVILNDKPGILVFIDKDWITLEGSAADVMCRVVIDGEVDERTGFPHHGEWCRLSQLQKTAIKNKMENKTHTKPEVSIDTLYSLDIRFCHINEVENILKNPKKPFDEIDNPVKAYKLTVDTGFDERTIVTNIVHIPREKLHGAITTFILNLPEIQIRGVQSKGMIFMIDHNELLISANAETGKILI